MTCKQCKHFDECQFDCECNHSVFDQEYAIHCGEFQGRTNADRIRAMTDEELVKFMEELGTRGCPEPARDCRASCTACMMEWLQQPAEGD